MMEMAHEAILSLGDRTGSSNIAIGRYILAHNDHLEDNKMFKSRLNAALKSAVKANKFKKIKNSYKIIPKKKKKQTTTKPTQLLELESKLSPLELQALRIKQAKEREAEETKLALQKQEQERLERIKKRRFPMEDTKLHSQDVELHVKPNVPKRPSLPYFFQATVPFEQRVMGGKTPSSILTNSKVDQLEYGNRGLVPELLQVYHFFRGDIHFTLPKHESLVPEFGLSNLLHAVEEVVNGNAKKSRLVPPLLSHLFVTSLQLLLTTTTTTTTQYENGRFANDFEKLASALSAASWGEVCVCYMNAMERYYTSNASVNEAVVPCGIIDVPYLMGVNGATSAAAAAVTPAKVQDSEDLYLPDGYCAYLGNPHGILAIAHAKLQKMDPWNLKAEELMALLRALTDDILGSNPDIANDLARRYVFLFHIVMRSIYFL
jgi:mannose/fructose/N-acetylgalactosamine-specific phosphotransferase system component IIB